MWQLDDLVYRKPSWHARKIKSKDDSTPKNADADSDSDVPPGRSPSSAKKKKSGSKKPLSIMAPGNESDEGSMPSLQTISESSEAEDNEFDDDDEEEEEEDSDEDSEDEDEHYDEDEEDHLREMLREAMDVATADPDFYNPRREAADFRDMAEDRKGNPFIKLLGSLRGILGMLLHNWLCSYIVLLGRMFNANPNLKSTARAEPRHPYMGSKPPSSAYTPVQPGAAKAPPKATPAAKKG